MEDTGIVFAEALNRLLAEHGAVQRYAHAAIPMDEALAEVVIDVSGRPYLVFEDEHLTYAEVAAQVLALFDGSAASLDTAVEAIETLYTAATDPINGDFLMPLVGVLDNPFAV